MEKGKGTRFLLLNPDPNDEDLQHLVVSIIKKLILNYFNANNQFLEHKIISKIKKTSLISNIGI